VSCSILRKAEAVAIVTASFALAAFVVRNRTAVEESLRHLGFWAYPLAVAVFAIVASAPFSVTDALAIMNGVVFGPVAGSLVNAVGIVLAACVGYAIARRTAVLLEVERYVEGLPRWVTRFRVGSPGFLVAVRIIPGIGGTVATNVAAAFRVPLIVHIWTMSAIAVPICTALAIFGDDAANFVAKLEAPVRRYYHEHRPRLHPAAPTPTGTR
jgi:uncharacterized membrane protein YdjX (TVP38/TMEM64 family)